MTFNGDRIRAIHSIEKEASIFIDTPFQFSVGKYNGGYHGNEIQMRGSKLFKNRKRLVVEAISNFKKIDKLCKTRSNFKIEKLIEKLIVYSNKKIRKKTLDTICGLSEEVINIFNETDI